MKFDFYLHFFKDGGSIVGDDNFAIGGHEHLVHALGTERGLQEGGNGAGSHDVNLQATQNENVSHSSKRGSWNIREIKKDGNTPILYI